MDALNLKINVNGGGEREYRMRVRVFKNWIVFEYDCGRVFVTPNRHSDETILSSFPNAEFVDALYLGR